MRRKIARKTLCLVLALAVALIPTASFAAVLGDELSLESVTIAEQTVLNKGIYWNSSFNDRLTENFVTYEAGASVIPMVAYGNDIYGAASLKTVVSMAEAKGQHVFAALNGDFFNMANGVAVGPVIQEGILKTSESSKYNSIAFYRDGSAFIGRMDMNISINGEATGGTPIKSLLLNKMVTKVSGLMLYTDDYEASTKATIPTYNVLLSVVDGSEPRVNGTVDVVVESASEASGAYTIPDGKMVLTMATGTEYTGTLSQLKSFKAGDRLTISFAANHSWDDVYMAIGGETKLVTGGNIVAPTNSSKEPRTAVGIKRDGSVIFYTVDGRQTGYSAGCTLYQVAARLVELGCVEAINLDGGGSTTLQAIYPGDTNLTTVNSPSGSSLRNCGNYILLATTQRATGNLAHLQPHPYNLRLLAGAKHRITVKAMDDYYYPVAVPAHVEYEVDEHIGSIDENGIFTAGPTAGTGTITAISGNATGTSQVTVVERPDSVTMVNQESGQQVTSVSLNIGQTYDFSVNATYKKAAIVTSDTSYRWSVSGGIGTVDEEGVFTAVNGGQGTITAEIGGLTTSVNVTVSSTGSMVEDFEGSSYKLWTGTSDPLSVAINDDLTKVRYGWKSAKVDYSFAKTGSNSLSIPATMTFAKEPTSLTFWVYGDGSGNALSLTVETIEGEEKGYSVGTLDFTGWRQMSVALQEGVSAITSLNLTYKGSQTGTLYVDQFISGYGSYVDQIPPVIQMSRSGQTLTATISDNMDAGIGSDDIALTYDGASWNFTYDGIKVTANLPASDGYIHRVAMTVTDESGNIGRQALTIPGGDSLVQPFVDMNNHWAKESTTYLYYQNIINGSSTAAGLAYKPDNNMTRSEFAVIMSNWLVADLSMYEGVILPFADLTSIPSWALGSVKAMYSLGYVEGSQGADGKLYFKPQSPITRQEAMTIIGRTQPRGYAESSLSFKDSSQVASWALPYVRSLVGQKVVEGTPEGYLRPLQYVSRAQVAKIIFSMR